MLKTLTTENDLDIIAAYGSSKDIQIYTSINIPASKIYIIGRSNRKLSTSCTVSWKKTNGWVNPDQLLGLE